MHNGHLYVPHPPGGKGVSSTRQQYTEEHSEPNKDPSENLGGPASTEKLKIMSPLVKFVGEQNQSPTSWIVAINEHAFPQNPGRIFH